ncbi:hypothetical protein E3P99_03867 [Wallemia hederae]|uniref:NmrA-like domain-containing protein n=1 Tax=Wallemia hederae TaxID=1540922 RepID=A0A4T0FDP7_9BASI|nr:hypothetical protein E3P99_03867 [Wallemia hederae]
MSSRVAVFPAVGQLGSSITSHLGNLIDHSDLILASRTPSKISIQDATLRSADYDNSESLVGVFEGVDILILISYPSLHDDHRFQAHKRAIDSAIDSGIKHIYYSSLAFAGEGSESVSQVMQAHLMTEAYLANLAKNGKVSYTAIREGLYNESYPLYLSDLDVNSPPDEIKLPHDGLGEGVAWASIDNLGEATAKLVSKVINGEKKWVEKAMNKVLLLSGPKAYTLSETLSIVSKKAKKDIKIKNVSIEEYSSQPHLLKNFEFYSRLEDDPAAGAKKWAQLWAKTFEAIRRGETAVTSTTLQELLGRKPTSMEETILGKGK